MEHGRHNASSWAQNKPWLYDFKRRRACVSLGLLLRIRGGNSGIWAAPFKGNSTSGDNGGKFKGQRYPLKEGKKISPETT